MPATESLTIEIQGDSSGLSQALDSALSQVESLQSAAESASSTAAGIGGRLASVSTALQPLQLVGQQLTRISQQAAALAQQPITLNVQPALSALQSLMVAIQAVAAQLRTISLPGPGPIGPGGTSPGTPPRTSPRPGPSSTSPYAVNSSPASAPMSAILESQAVAHSSPFTGDMVRPASSPHARGIPDPALLLIRDRIAAAEHSPSPTGTQDSRSPIRSSSSFNSSSAALQPSSSLDHSSSTVNHFGGITIEVRETADVNALMRDLRLQGLATRHRQG